MDTGRILVRFWTGPRRFQHFLNKAIEIGFTVIDKDGDKESLYVYVDAQNIREATNIVYDALEYK